MNPTDPQNRGRTLALTGVILQAGPIIGAIGSAFGMFRAFNTLAANNISDPRALSGNIATVLIATTIGLFVSLIGLVLICLALFVSRYREPWFYWFLVIYGITLLIAFPVGTVLGVMLLVYCVTNKAEFLSPRPPPHLPQN